MNNKEWVEAKPGYRFALTVTGFETARIRRHLSECSPNYKAYTKKVPKSWVDKNFVEQVKEG